MYELIVTEIAEQHTVEACIYYEEQQEGLSDRFLSDLHTTYKNIATHPQYYGFISTDKKIRDVRLKRFPFVVIYEVVENTVIVIDVFHTHRKPIF